MNDNATTLAKLIERIESYSKISVKLFKLNAIDKSADVVSSFVSMLVCVTMVALSLLIINIGIALWVGNLLGNSFLGFFVVGGFYAVLTLLLHIFSGRMIKLPVSNTIIKHLLKSL